MKKILLNIFLITLSILSFAFVYDFGYCTYAEQNSKQNITYVALGDSIAEGYYINLKQNPDNLELIADSKKSYGFVEDCYADLIRKNLEEQYEEQYNVTAYNYAYSGDTCQDLLDFIAEFYDDKSSSVKNPNDANQTYDSLTNLKIFNSVKRANIISICIGANNILSEATELIPAFLGLSSPSVSQKDIENRLKDKILGNKDNNIKGLQAEFSELLDVLYKLNPNAKIYITNVYNPYKVLIGDPTILYYASKTYPNFTQDNLNTLSKITEAAIAGVSNSEGNQFTGINNVIEAEILEFKKKNPNCNFVYVDSKAEFEKKYDDTSDETKKSYNNYVNTQLENLTVDKINIYEILSGTADINSIAQSYIDPHPTYNGHELIFNAHNDAGITANLPNFEVTTKINNSDVVDSYTINQGGAITVESEVDNTDYSYDFTYTLKTGETVIKTYTENPVEIKHEDLLNGTYDIYLSINTTNDNTNYIVCKNQKLTTLTVQSISTLFNVTFKSNGGIFTSTNNSDDIISQFMQDAVVGAPEIKKQNYTLIGWYVDDNQSLIWNFENQVTEDLTLTALWQENPKLTYNLNGGIGTTPNPVWANNLDGEQISLEKIEAVKTNCVALCWNTNADGSGIDYYDTFVLTENTTLYVKWVSLEIIEDINNITNQNIDSTSEIKLSINADLSTEVVWSVFLDGHLYKTFSDKSMSFTPDKIGNYSASAQLDNYTTSVYNFTVIGEKKINLIYTPPQTINSDQYYYLDNYFDFDANFYCTKSDLIFYKIKDNKKEVINLNSWQTLPTNCQLYCEYSEEGEIVGSNYVATNSESPATPDNPDLPTNPEIPNTDEKTQQKNKEIFIKCGIAGFIIILFGINILFLVRTKDEY